jgi:hypothetical protein
MRSRCFAVPFNGAFRAVWMNPAQVSILNLFENELNTAAVREGVQFR